MSTRIPLFAAVSAWLAAGLAAFAAPQATASRANQVAQTPARYGPGKVLLAGEAPMGASRMYPSPVFQDMNGDGRLDLVIGDLWGKITVALRSPGDGSPRFGADEPLLASDGKPLNFENW